MISTHRFPLTVVFIRKISQAPWPMRLCWASRASSRSTKWSPSWKAEGILEDIEADKVEFSVDNEDIHMNIETLLTQRIGDAGKRLHTARSRNDQVAVDTRLYVKEEIPVIIGKILDLEEVLVEKAKEHTDTVMPGYTHLQRAQPTTFGHYMMLTPTCLSGT